VEGYKYLEDEQERQSEGPLFEQDLQLALQAAHTLP